MTHRTRLALAALGTAAVALTVAAVLGAGEPTTIAVSRQAKVAEEGPTAPRLVAPVDPARRSMARQGQGREAFGGSSTEANLTRASDQELRRLREENRVLRKELETLRREQRESAHDAALDSAYGAWLSTLRKEELPPEDALAMVEYYATEWPVRLQPHEGLWIAERQLRDDWERFGDSADEAVIHYLGAERILSEIPAEAAAAWRALWRREGIISDPPRR